MTLNGSRGPFTHGVDTGFLVFNQRTYPRLVRLFDELGVETAASEMSFSVQVPDAGLEWSGRNLGAVFAQRANLLRPRFLRMLADIVRFGYRSGARDAAALDALTIAYCLLPCVLKLAAAALLWALWLRQAPAESPTS